MLARLSKAVLFAALTGASANTGDDRTITKVVKILEGMLDKSKADGDADRKIYAKFICYCNSKKETKIQEIADLAKAISILEDDIAQLKGSNGKLSVDLAQVMAEKASNQEQQTAANTTRADEQTAFQALQADSETAIGQMTHALDTLTEIGADQTLGAAADHEQFMAGNSLVSKTMKRFRGVRSAESLAALKVKISAALTSAASFLPHKQAKSVQSFVQAPFTGTYTAQSGEVVGILKQMRETFEANLESATAAEEAAQKAHDAFILVKVREFEELSTIELEKQAQIGANDGSLASKSGELASAQTEKATREQFLSELIPMCGERAKEYEHRTMMRANEDSALSQAIAILDKDSAFKVFGKVDATNTGATEATFFLQYASVKPHAQASPRLQVQQLLQKAAKSQRSMRLVKIVALLETGNPFNAVLEAIDKLVALIGEEGQADQNNLNWCNSERTTSNGTIDELSLQITTLESSINTLTTEIEEPETGLKDVIAATELSLKENFETQRTSTLQRTDENQAYQADIANLVEVQEIIKAAAHVLQKYYDKVEEGVASAANEPTGTTVLTGETEAHAETWENEVGYQGQSENGKKVLEMLGFIVDNAKTEETAAHTAEHNAQHAFEDAMQTLKNEEATLSQTLADTKLTLAEKEKQLAEDQAELAKTQADQASVIQYLVEIKPGCDFITTNIDYRNTRRTSETAALEQAKTLLKDTPAYQAAEAEAHLAALGACRDKCEDNGEEHVICKACLAKVEIPGYCAGHPDTTGC